MGFAMRIADFAIFGQNQLIFDVGVEFFFKFLKYMLIPPPKINFSSVNHCVLVLLGFAIHFAIFAIFGQNQLIFEVGMEFFFKFPKYMLIPPPKINFSSVNHFCHVLLLSLIHI